MATYESAALSSRGGSSPSLCRSPGVMATWERERLEHARQRLRSGKWDEVRALAAEWGVPQKVAGKRRSVSELRRDLKEKIGRVNQID